MQTTLPFTTLPTISSRTTTTTTITAAAAVSEFLWNHSSTVDYDLNPVLTTCSETSVDCRIDHSIQCVGDPIYCNLTKEEYVALLYDYISPTVPEWILICSHIIVFLMGLVSFN
jgi:hypothetical protein